MRTLIAAALAALLLSGCATFGAPGAEDDALLQCRAQADEHHKARYTPQWEAAVKDCLDARAEAKP
jgi:outer membrane biogenesis lipoprotein LolB